jgi:hypothetical protein
VKHWAGVSRTFFRGGTSTIIFHIRGTPTHENIYGPENVDIEVHSSVTAKLLWRKFICKELIMCVCMCWGGGHTSSEKIETFFMLSRDIWSSSWYFKMFMYMFHNSLWNP